MTLTRWLPLPALACALALAACGSSSSSSSSSSSAPASSSSSAAASTSAATSSAATSTGAASTGSASVPFKSIEQTVPTGYAQPKPKKLVLAYMNPEGSSNQILTTFGQSMRLAVQKLGGTYIEKDAEGSVNTQVSQFNQLLAQKVNGIAVFALDPKSLAPDVARARAAGIHLVTIDYNFTNTSASGLQGYESQVWQRRDQASYMTAQEMAKLLPHGATIGTITFAIAVPSIVYNIQRDTYWAKQFGFNVVGPAANPSDDIAGGQTAMTSLLGKYPSLKGVMAYNDPSAIGAYAAARSQGKTNLALTGINGGSDALGAVAAGRETFSIKLDAPSIGQDFAWGLYDLSEGVKIPATVKAGPPQLVNKANVGSTLSGAQELKKQYPGS